VQTFFGILFKKKSIEIISSFLNSISSVYYKKQLNTYHDNCVGYGFEINRRASFNQAISLGKDLKILLIGDYQNKRQIEKQILIIEHEIIWDKDIYIQVRNKIRNYLCHIKGIFCLILLDLSDQRICIFSDKHGLIPIYYYHKEGVFVFGSSLKCVLSYSQIPRIINSQVIYELFKLGFVIPPSTLINDLKMLMPGEILEFSKNIVITKVFEEQCSVNYKLSIEDASEEYYKFLVSAILECICHVDKCSLLLSGGIDSAVIASIINNYSNINLKCYTIDLNQNNPIEIIEAKKIAELYKIDHHIVDRLSDKMMTYFPKVVWYNEAPIFNGITEYILCNDIEDNTELVLTGDGNDLIWGIFSQLPNDFLLQRGLRFSDYYLKVRASLSDNLLDNIVLSPLDKSFTHEKINMVYSDTGNFFRDSCCTDIKLFGGCGIFNQYNKIRIEPNTHLFRFPYLDKKLVTLINTIPDTFKIKAQNHEYIRKYLFKYVLEKKNILPNEIIYTKKTWMSSPNAEWLRGGLRVFFEETVFHKNSSIKKFFNINLIKDIWFLHLNNKQDYSYFLMMIFTFELWHKMFIESTSMDCKPSVNIRLQDPSGH